MSWKSLAWKSLAWKSLAWKSLSIGIAAVASALALQSPASAAVTYSVVGADTVFNISFSYTTDTPVLQSLGVFIPCTDNTGARNCEVVFFPAGSPTYTSARLTLGGPDTIGYLEALVLDAPFHASGPELLAFALPASQFTQNLIITNAYNGMFTISGVPGGVPEPAAWALMIVGLGGVGVSLRSRRRGTLAAA